MTKLVSPPDDDPVAIAQYLLDATEATYVARDFEAFALHLRIPHTIGTFEGDYEVTSSDMLRANFDAMSAVYDAKGMIALKRRVSERVTFEP